MRARANTIKLWPDWLGRVDRWYRYYLYLSYRIAEGGDAPLDSDYAGKVRWGARGVPVLRLHAALLM